ncbi:response regulator [Ktedonobacter robiniae]|nr:response regulator [Ktedonobacter robiniae]
MLPSMADARLLVVDDDPALLQALPHMLRLRLQNLHVDTAESVQLALELVRAQSYDVIVSDIKMPGMDGFDLLTALQDLQPETPVLLITGHGEHDLAIRALRGGAYDYILKPIDRDDFAAAVRRAIDTVQLRQQVKHQQQELEQYAASLEQQVYQRTEELQQANVALASVNESREQMLRMVVHEMAGPLTSVKGLMQLMKRQVRRGQSGERLVQNFDTVEGAIKRMERLIADLHDAAHIQMQQFHVQREQTDLVALCQQAIDEFACERVAPTVSTEDQCIGVVDAQRLSQVLLNLLNNARKYSPAERPISVTFQAREQEICIAVQDEGAGIAPNALQHIFEQFYRVGGVEGQPGSVKGLGLGLYIARAIVEEHGGRLEVQSRLGQGSTFSINLPTSELAVNAAKEAFKMGTWSRLWKIEWQNPQLDPLSSVNM